MSAVTRRGALSLLPVVGAALAASPAASKADPSREFEHHCNEVARFLQDWHHGQFMARINPAGHARPGLVGLFDIRSWDAWQGDMHDAHQEAVALRALPPARQVIHHARTIASILRESYPGKYQIVESMDDAHVSIFRVPR